MQNELEGFVNCIVNLLAVEFKTMRLSEIRNSVITSITTNSLKKSIQNYANLKALDCLNNK